MASKPVKSGQPNTLVERGGQKKRSPTSTPHTGSRVEPSHTAQTRRKSSKSKGAKTTRG